MAYISPLRYPGGKSKLANFIKLIYETNNLLDGHYVEPYAGGAGVALSLLLEEYAQQIHINDLNKPIFSFWDSLLNHTEDLCRLINDTSVTMEEWEKQRKIQQHHESTSTLDLGFSTFFINRTSRSGIIKNGGPIGGKAQLGEWKINARYNKKNLINRIQKIARYRRRINIYNQDAVDFLNQTLPQLPEETLVYLDPPYYVKGQRLYTNHYKHEDHIQLALQVTSRINHNWIVSYDNTPPIRNLYQGQNQIVYDLRYTAASRYNGSEVMIFCDNLIVPDVETPVSIKLPYQGSLLPVVA